MMLPDPPANLSELAGSMKPINVEEHTGLVVVLPHPDDESFAAGGLISLFHDAGKPVMYVCGTWGDGGRRMGSPNFATRESLRDIRETELQEACAILGCELHMLGLRDKTVEFEDPEHVAGLVRDILVARAPSLVVGFYPGYAVHPDHDSLGEATRLAVAGMSGKRPTLLAVAVGDRAGYRAVLGEPHVYADIRHVGQRKLDALKAHRSQTQAMFQHLAQNDDSAITDQEKEFRRQSFQIERFYVLDTD